MSQDTNENDVPYVELEEEDHALLDATTEAVKEAIGTDTGAEPIAADILLNTPEELQDRLITMLKECAEGIGVMELGEIPYESEETRTVEVEIDGKKYNKEETVTVGHILPAASYELVNILTLTGARRRHALNILTGMGAYVLRVGGGAIDMLQSAAAIANSPRFPELLGVLYRPTDGRTLNVDQMIAVGTAIDEQFNVRNVAGVLYRFFSSSGSGAMGAIPSSLKQFLAKLLRLSN